MIHSATATLQSLTAPSLREVSTQPVPEHAAPAPQDTVQTSDPEAKPSFPYRLMRGTLSGAAAGVGGAVGATTGAVKGAFSDSAVLSPGVHRLVRGGACLAGLAVGVRVGMMFGPLGAVAGLLAGPIAGAIAGSAAAGAVEGATASMRGAVAGAAEGGKRAWSATFQSIDIITGHAPAKDTATSDTAAASPSQG